MSWQAEATPIVENIRARYAVPGLVIARQHDNGPVEYLVSGTDARGKALSAGSLFPVASITKLGAALAVLRMADIGMLQLDDPLEKYLPEAAAAQDEVTLRELLSHTAGLPEDIASELAPYDRKLDWPRLARGCLETPPETEPQERVRYSNVGFGLLAIVVERLAGQSFQDTLAKDILAPLQMEGYLGHEPPRQPVTITGKLGSKAGTDLEPYNTPFWRSLGLPWGGLVTNASGTLALARVFAGVPSGFLSPGMIFEATHDQTGGLDGGFFQPLWWPRSPWGLGAELRGDKTPHWTPTQASAESFGHAGATGCMVWHDPVRGISWAILGAHTFENWWMQWARLGVAILAG